MNIHPFLSNYFSYFCKKPINIISMKKQALILLACVAAFTCMAQTQKQIITGIGKLKLDSPISLLSDLGYNENSPKIKTEREYMAKIYNKTEGHEVYALGSDTITGDNCSYEAYYNPKVKVFYIPKCQILESLSISKVYLTFYNDNLIDISCDFSFELKNAFNLKYGQATETTEKEDRQFTDSKTGEKVTRTNIHQIYKWDTNNPEIDCTGRELTIYVSDDKTIETSYFNVKKSKLIKEIDQEEMAYRKRVKIRKENAQRDALKGL